MIKLYLEHGADVNAKAFSNSVDWEGWTPFHVACRRGNMEIVKLLMAHGADINAKTDKGDTPASLARVNGHLEIVSLLLEEPVEMADVIKSAKTWKPAFTSWYGKPETDFTITDITGKQHKISDYKGKNLILNFWATWCGPCLREIPDIIKLRNTVSEDELAILGISTEKGQTDLVKEFAAKEKMNYTILVSEDKLVPPYSEINAIPTTFIIDPKGNIKIATVGTLSLNDLNNIIKAQ